MCSGIIKIAHLHNKAGTDAASILRLESCGILACINARKKCSKDAATSERPPFLILESSGENRKRHYLIRDN